jgi:hypothetical protein
MLSDELEPFENRESSPRDEWNGQNEGGQGRGEADVI